MDRRQWASGIGRGPDCCYPPMRLEQYVRLKRLARMLDVSAKTVQRWVRDGKFPKPVYIGGEPRWRESDVVIFLEKMHMEEVAEQEISPVGGCSNRDKLEHLGTSESRPAKKA